MSTEVMITIFISLKLLLLLTEEKQPHLHHLVRPVNDIYACVEYDLKSFCRSLDHSINKTRKQ